MTGPFDRPPDRDDHPAERARVRRSIGAAIMTFAIDHNGQQFHINELQSYVAKRVPTAPASADRILRQLRQQGSLDYRVISRSNSLYEFQFQGELFT